MYYFPKCTEYRSNEEQLQKIYEELIEVNQSDTSFERLKELLNVIHACETYIRYNYFEGEVKSAIAAVRLDNERRGYYGDD